ncbi:MAG: alpha/beta fold hydrolase [Burkholderiaceae bacterium]
MSNAGATRASRSCAHACMGSSRQWRLLAQRLAPGSRVVAGDLAGMGKSPAWLSDQGLTLDEDLTFWAPVIERAGPRFHLIGHSYGGALALKIAVAMPARIRSLTL